MNDYRISRDADAEGFAQLLEQMLATSSADPGRARTLVKLRGTVALTARDADVAVLLDFRGSDGVAIRPWTDATDVDVRIDTTAAWLLEAPGVPRIAGVTNLFTRRGRAFAKAVLRKDVHVSGYSHVRLMRGFASVL